MSTCHVEIHDSHGVENGRAGSGDATARVRIFSARLLDFLIAPAFLLWGTWVIITIGEGMSRLSRECMGLAEAGDLLDDLQRAQTLASTVLLLGFIALVIEALRRRGEWITALRSTSKRLELIRQIATIAFVGGSLALIASFVIDELFVEYAFLSPTSPLIPAAPVFVVTWFTALTAIHEAGRLARASHGAERGLDRNPSLRICAILALHIPVSLALVLRFVQVMEAQSEFRAASRLIGAGQAARRAGDPDRALGLFVEAIRRSDSPLARWDASRSRAEGADQDGALADLDRGLELNPDDALCHAYRAVLLLRLGRIEAARAEQRYLARHPDPEARKTAAKLAARIGGHLAGPDPRGSGHAGPSRIP